MPEATPIQLEPGRLALRKPELGGFLMVEVEGVDAIAEELYHRVKADAEGNDWGYLQPLRDFLPVLKPGDVVPPPSLLYQITAGGTHVWSDRDGGEITDVDPPMAVLRWGTRKTEGTA